MQSDASHRKQDFRQERRTIRPMESRTIRRCATHETPATMQILKREVKNMAKYNIENMKLSATPEQIIEAYETIIKRDDIFGEYSSCLNYLPFENVKPYLKEGVTEKEWDENRKNDEDLRNDFKHYESWWREKIEDERGISVCRGKAQFAIRMMLAGCPEWKEIFTMDGGWYQRGAFKKVAELFGFEPVE